MLFEIRSESHIGYKFSEERKREMSRTHRGKNSNNWKGGISPVVPYFRGMLYEWKLDSLKQYNYKCALTKENNNDLEIHHINKNFSEIIQETFLVLELEIYDTMMKYSDKDLKLINKTFIDLNYKYGLGVPLKMSLHKIFHATYGRGNNTKEQLDIFINDYNNGKFDEEIKLKEANFKIKRHKKKSNGERKQYKKVKKEEVIEIRKYIAKGMPDRYISKQFKISDTVVYNIRKGISWKEVV